jgi:hypothetical protein
MKLIFGFDLMSYNGPIPNCLPAKFLETIYEGGEFYINKSRDYFLEKWKCDIPLFINHDYDSFIIKKSVYEILEDKKNGKIYTWFYLVEPHSGLDLFFGNHPIHNEFLLNRIPSIVIDEIKNGNCKLLINYTVDGGANINEKNFTKIFNYTRENNLKDENVYLIFSDFELKNNIKKLGFNYNVFDYNFYLFLKSHEFNKLISLDNNINAVQSEQEFLENIDKPKKDFLLLTRHWKKHRIFLLNKLHRLGLENNLVSWEKSYYNEKIIEDLLKNDPNYEFAKILKEKSNYVDVDDLINVLGINNENKKIYTDTFLSIVAETIFYKEDLNFPSGYLSEKIWKPIGHLQPFILAGPANSLKYIKERYGFKTFHPLIDETYDLEYDDDLRLRMIENEMEKFSKKSLNDKIEFMKQTKDICLFNRNLFLNYGVINGHNHEIRKIYKFLHGENCSTI